MNKKKITIVNTGSGNILSIKRAFEKFDAEVFVSNDKKEILSASRLVLPGVGAFNNAIKNLKLIEFFDVISSSKFKEIPLLGICLGMQLFFEESEEFGKFQGLNLIRGKDYSHNFASLQNLDEIKKAVKIIKKYHPLEFLDNNQHLDWLNRDFHRAHPHFYNLVQRSIERPPSLLPLPWVYHTTLHQDYKLCL